MDIRELMTGDWVRSDLREVQQVVELREAGAMLAYNDIYPYDEIEPVSITSAILEANGFRKSAKSPTPLGDLWVWHEKAGGACYGRQIEVTLYREPVSGVKMLVEIASPSRKCGGGVNLFNTCDIEYVHELQHAIRQCGIGKEIIIKKDGHGTDLGWIS